MRKPFKTTLITIFLLFLLGIIGIIALVTFVDANRFKDTLTNQVSQRTGRTFTINGDMRWTLFPWLGLQVHNIELGNAPSFDKQPFAKAQEIDFRLKLLPLLFGQLEIGNLSAKGLDLLLIKNAQGIGNWQGLSSNPVSNNKADNSNSASHFSPSIIHISSIEIKDGHITWLAQQTGKKIELNKLFLHSNAIRQGKPFDIVMRFNLISSQPKLAGDFTLNSKLTLDQEKQKYAVEKLKLTAQLADPHYENKKLDITFNADILIDLIKQTLAVPGFSINAANLNLLGSLQGQQLNSGPILQGNIKIPVFNVKKFLTAIGKPPAPTKEANILQKAALSLNFLTSKQQSQLKDLVVTVDDTTLHGSVTTSGSAQKTYQFSFDIDKINLDHYLAAFATNGSTANTSNTKDNKASNQTEQSADDFLQQFNARGKLQIAELKFANLSLTDLRAAMSANKGLIQLNPVQCKLYQGKYNGTISLDKSRKISFITAKQSLENIQAEPFLHDFVNFTRVQISGVANMHSQLTMSGNTAEAIKRTLNGSLTLNFNNGALKGINIPYYVKLGLALAKREMPPAATSSNQTDFGNLSSSMVIKNGIASTNDLLLTGRDLIVKGQGSANLVSEQLDFTLHATLPKTKEIQNFPIPIRITGPFDKPSIRPDLEAIAKALLQNAIENRGTKIKEQIGNIIDKNLGKDLGDKLKKNLNIDGLFK